MDNQSERKLARINFPKRFVGKLSDLISKLKEEQDEDK